MTQQIIEPAGVDETTGVDETAGVGKNMNTPKEVEDQMQNTRVYQVPN